MTLLETTAQSLEIEKLFEESHEFTIINSPYLKINNRLKSKISDCYNRNEKNLILFRKNELTKAENEWISNQNVMLVPIKNLHAKCYMNERSALITSMNLYDYSQINNHELGIKLTISKNITELSRHVDLIGNIIKTDHPNFDFKYFDRSKSLGKELTMGKLYSELVNNYNFTGRLPGNDGVYRYLCQVAIELHNFSRESFYFDKSALLRSAPLNQETYDYLKKEFIKRGVRK